MGHGLRARGRCELFCGEQGPLGPPRDDLLTYDQTRQLHTELLAGNAQPEELPRFLKDLVVIADTGCGTSFGNTARLFIDTYKCDTSINGASGMFTARTKGTMKLPMMDDKDNRLLHRARRHPSRGVRIHADGGGSCGARAGLDSPPATVRSARVDDVPERHPHLAP